MPLVTGMYMHNVIIKQEGFFTRGDLFILENHTSVWYIAANRIFKTLN